MQEAIAAIVPLGTIRAVSLVGSRAIDPRDPNADDWDLEAYTTTDREPSETQRRQLWQQKAPFDQPQATAVGGRNDRFAVGEQRFGFTYYAADEVEQAVAAALEGRWHNVRLAGGDYLPEMLGGKLSVCQPLWDPEGLVASWRQRLAPYPRALQLKALQELVFESRAHLQCLRRACELEDLLYFRECLGQLVQTIVRLIFAAHNSWFRGSKRALGRLEQMPDVPAFWGAEITALVSAPCAPNGLFEQAARAHRLLVQVAECVAAQGAEEARWVRRGLSYWPDVDPLTLRC